MVAAQGPEVKARDRMSRGLKIARGAFQIGRTPVPPMLWLPRLGPHGSGMCHFNKDFKPVWGELRECSPIPHQHQPQQATVAPQHSLPDCEPKLAILKVAQKKGQPEVVPVPFLNPDPITHLVGGSNKAPVIVDGQELTTLIDLGAQDSSVNSQFCEDLTLQIQPLGQLLELEGTRGSAIPYLGFMEVNL